MSLYRSRLRVLVSIRRTIFVDRIICCPTGTAIDRLNATIHSRNFCKELIFPRSRTFPRKDNIVKDEGFISSSHIARDFWQQVRWFASKSKGETRKGTVKSYKDLVDYDSDDDYLEKVKDEDNIEDDVDSESEEDDDNESGEQKSWKDVTYTLAGFRADKVIAAGLGISRKQVEDAFLSGKLRFNGEILTKKSKKIDVGDTLDLVKSSKGEMIDVMRVTLKKIDDEKTRKNKFVAVLRRWKHLSIPNPKKR